ncbi:MAG: hypothetical protein LBC75_06925 [Fibromonadaceae bacterium]|jgi:hypothetical protein|nr:hypothetical protein [Fibromonadaceae bacterium]
MLKTFAFSIMISFALLCLSNCGGSDSSGLYVDGNNIIRNKDGDSVGILVGCKSTATTPITACGGNSYPYSYPDLSSISKCLRTQSKSAEEPLAEFAVLTDSDDKTHVHLNEIELFCSSSLKVGIKYTVDTLKLEEFWDENENNFNSKCSCNSSLDLTLNYRYDNIKYLVYNYVDGGTRIFPVRYE